MAHKFTDLGILGGFPLTLDDLEHDRNGVYETIAGLFSDAVGVPLFLSGSEYENGWVMIAGEILPFTIPPVPLPLSPGYDFYVVISQVDYPVVFEDTTTHDAITISRTATYIVGDTSAPPAGGILLSSFKIWSEVFGKKARSAWVTLWAGSVSAFDGTVEYKKNILTNTLQIKGSLTIKAAGISGANPLYYGLPGVVLPVDCRPATTAPFIMRYRYHSSSLKEVNDVDYIDQLNAEVATDGTVTMGLRKPKSPTTDYAVSFNCLIPLD